MVAIDLATSRHEERYSGAGNVWGVYAVNRATGRVELFTARATILATGGAGRTYLFSTAPRGATGDGIAMAWRAGCRVSNMEMMQFHPTCLYNLEVKNFLITEAVRGEGGHLLIPEHRAIASCPISTARRNLRRATSWRARSTMRSSGSGLDYVHLDISHRGAEFVKEHFPNIYEKLLGLGIDMTKEPIPVVPAQHYTCGGVVIDLRRPDRSARPLCGGRVSAQSGCTAPTGSPPIRCSNVSCSARRARAHIAAHWDDLPAAAADPPVGRKPRHRFGRGSRHQAELDRDPPLHVELCRHRPHHQAARARAAPHQAADRARSNDYYGHFRVTPDLIELRNLLQTAELIVRSALHRKESRGLHYTLDYPETLPEAVDTVLVP